MKIAPWLSGSGKENWRESSPMKKDFRVLVDEKLDMIQQRALAVQEANRILGWIQSNVASRSGVVVLTLCSAETHLMWRVLLWDPEHRKDVDLLKWVQRRAEAPLLWRWAERIWAVQSNLMLFYKCYLAIISFKLLSFYSNISKGVYH